MNGLTPRRKRREVVAAASPLTYLVAGAFASVLAFPFYWMFLTALKSDDDLYDPANVPVIFNDPPTLEHVRHLFGDSPYAGWVLNTAWVGVAVVAITLALSLPAAYALARARSRRLSAVGTALFLTYLVPPTLLFLPLSRLVSSLGLHDSLWALVLIYPSFTVPGSTWLLAGLIKTVPTELEDAALIDGCTRAQALRSVVVPALAPGVVAVAVFSFALAVNEFTYATTFITSGERKTLSSGLPSLVIRGDIVAWGPLMAGVLVPSVVIAAVYTGLITWLLRWRATIR